MTDKETMTNEEAISQLESLAYHCRTMQDEPGDIWEDDIKALDKAIKALRIVDIPH